MHNEWFDDGRGDSPRLRPFDSPPRPSTETLAEQMIQSITNIVARKEYKYVKKRS